MNNRGPNFPGELSEVNVISICHPHYVIASIGYYFLVYVGVTTLLCSMVGPSHKVSSTLLKV